MKRTTVSLVLLLVCVVLTCVVWSKYFSLHREFNEEQERGRILHKKQMEQLYGTRSRSTY